MKTLAEKTGGFVVVQEEFDSEVFKNSYLKLFEVDQDMNLKMATNAQMEVFVSKELKLQGAIGPCVSLKKSGPMVSDQAIGQGQTSLWYLGGMVIFNPFNFRTTAVQWQSIWTLPTVTLRSLITVNKTSFNSKRYIFTLAAPVDCA